MPETPACHELEPQKDADSGDYGEEYYKHGCGTVPYERNTHWLHFFAGIADEIVRSLRPKSVFDAGCAWGFLVEAFCDRGVNARGRDISEYAISNVRPDMRPFCSVGSLTEPIAHGPYDLVTCIEVLEHMPEEEARQAIGHMTEVTESILFSSTPDDFNEPTHVNVHPIIYWLRLFAEYHFYPDLSLDASFLAPHAFLVRKRSAVPEDVLLLFNETVRLRGERAAFLTRHVRIEQLEAELVVLEATRRQVEDLRYKLEDSKLQTARSESSVAEWTAQSNELSQKLDFMSRQYDSLLADVQSLTNGPGWQFIVRYRDWLRANQLRHPLVWQLWESSMVLALRGVRLVGQALHPLPSSNLLVTSASGQASQANVSNPVSAAVQVSGSDYQSWIRENEPDAIQLEIQRRMGACFSYRPRVSVLVPVYKVALSILRDAINSVMTQTYDNWELCVSVCGSDNPEAHKFLEEAAAQDQRIRVVAMEANEGISGNSNRALTLATGEYLALLDHDDCLAPFALFEVVQLLNQDRTIDFIYSDKDQITEDGKERMRPLFKPQWSPDVMLNANYLTHLSVMRTEHVRQVGGWRKETDGAQDWDLFLRLVDRFGNIQHLAKVLYHWRQISTSVSMGGFDAKPYAADAQVRTVKEHCGAIGLRDVAIRHGEEGVRVTWPALNEERISIVYLALSPDYDTPDRAAKLADQTSHPNFEILIPTTTTSKPAQSPVVKCLAVSLDATLLDRIEVAVRSATGKTLVFIDEHVIPVERDWLKELTGPLQLPSIGVVGARLLDPHTRKLRHCGIVFPMDGRLEYIYAGQPEHVSEPFGSASWYRDWSAVSGACFAIRREVWDAVGGMSGDTLYPRLDINLNLKLQLRTDWRIFYNPYARLLQHHESAIEASMSGQPNQAMDKIRTYFPSGDPHFNPNLDCRKGNVSYRILQRHDGPATHKDYSKESQALVELYDFQPAQLERSNRLKAKSGTGRMETVTWLLPDFVNAFYGGVHTILRFADGFRRTHNVRSQFCILGHGPERRLRGHVAAAFPQLAASSDFFVVDSSARVKELPACDAMVSSLWTTAYAALECDNTRRKFYFIQDDEVLFYPAGSTSALVEATYGFGFYGICNTVSMLESYVARGGEGEYFSPCIDTSVFHANNRKPADGGLPYTLFFYGRPGHPRNCFELIGAALQTLRKRMGDELLVISAGADWDPRDHRLQGIVRNLGLLNYQSTGALYRMCDAGLVMMMTRHPSYLPLELMGCGALVVTNRNPDSAWLLKDGENCLLADLSPSSLADRLEEGLRNVPLRRRISAQASDFVAGNYSKWEHQIEKIYGYMREKC